MPNISFFGGKTRSLDLILHFISKLMSHESSWRHQCIFERLVCSVRVILVKKTHPSKPSLLACPPCRTPTAASCVGASCGALVDYWNQRCERCALDVFERVTGELRGCDAGCDAVGLLRRCFYENPNTGGSNP